MSEVRIEGYRDFQRLGAGGFATVYRAYQERFDRVVAVKVLNQTLDAKALRRFERECSATGRLSGHPNVVTVLDSGVTENGLAYMTTALMERGSLGDWIDQHGRMPLADVLQVGVKMCGALTDVHEAGILHRDIKPPNILVSKYGEPALADFGISMIGFADATGNTSSFTPQHTPPEVLEGNAPRVTMDVYSLGSTLYHLLAGAPAFDLAEDAALLPFIMRVMNEEVPPLPPEVAPPEVSAVLIKAMAKKPDDRYQTAAELGLALQELQHSLGQPVTPMAAAAPTTAGAGTDGDPDGEGGGIPSLLLPTTLPAFTTTATAPARSRSSTLLIAGVAAIVVIALIGIGAAISRNNDATVNAGSNGTPPSTTPAAQPNASPPTNGGRLVVGLPNEAPKEISPVRGGVNQQNSQVQSAIFEPLVRPAGTKVENVLAEKIEPNADFTEWTVTTRAGVVFHDGTPFNAMSVKRNIEGYKASIISTALLTSVVGIDATSESTAVIRMNTSWAAFPATITQMVMLSEASLRGEGLFGTGPFLSSTPPDSSKATTRRFERYWGPRPFLDEIEFRYMPDDQQRIAALDRGEIDLTFSSDPTLLAQEATRRPTLVERNALLNYIVLNTTKPPLDDPDVRRALALATDRKELVATTPLASVVTGFVSPDSPFYAGADELPYDPVEAKRLIRAHQDRSGKVGLKMDLYMSIAIGGDASRLTAQLKRMWEQADIVLQPNGVDASALGLSVITGGNVAAMAGIPMPVDPDALYVYFHSYPPENMVTLNLSRYNDDAIDDALVTGRSSTDEATRKQAYETVQRRIDENATFLFLVGDPWGLIASPRVTGLRPELAPHLIRGGTVPWVRHLGIEH